MNKDADNLQTAFADQLASFDSRLDSMATDVDMLTDIQAGIGKLLADHQASEKQIRRVLQERYDAGTLRKETFQLVKSMLDRYVTENGPASPGVPPAIQPPPRQAEAPPPAPVAEAVDGDDQFSSTAVIPAGMAPKESAEDRVQVGSVLRDRFMLQKRVSGGSMGVVYKALDRRLAEAGSAETFVAIKILSPQLAENAQALRALQQEAAKGRCLVHQNIVRFIDLDRDDDLYFIVMEWLDGRTLADILDSDDARAIDGKAAFRIVRQIGDALDYAHRCGIVHADVKPGNIMIMPDGTAKLFDFGVARVRQKQLEQHFDPGVLGALTPAYSSMQVLTGEAPAASDDVFSLACLLYRLVAGYRVFGPRNAAEASEAGMAPQRPQGISDNQWKALRKALSYARVTRYQSVREFLDAVDEPVAEAPVFEAPERFQVEERGSPGKWLAIIVVVLGLAGIGANHLGYLDPLLARLGSEGFVELPAGEETPVAFEDLPAVVEQPPVEVAGPASDPESAGAVNDALSDDDSGMVSLEQLPEAMGSINAAPAPVPVAEPRIDFSKLPSADVEIAFGDSIPPGPATNIVLREDGAPVIADFIRQGDLTTALTLRLEEIGFSGNRSPWATGQYAMSDSGLLSFPVGQDRARITLRTASDPRREADQQSTLRLREADATASDYATIVITLEDDDQRIFEAGLPVNTVAFASGQVSINESDPAVQVDVVRFNPDDTAIVIGFTVDDITATEGEDYFAPGNYSVSFGPGQRSARVLIPLVQDSLSEGDEAFVVELADRNPLTAIDVFHRIVVMIRDDEPPPL